MGRGGWAVSTLALYHDEPGSTPGPVKWKSCRLIAAGRRVLSGICRLPRPCISTLLHSHLISRSSALKTSMLTLSVPATLIEGNFTYEGYQHFVDYARIIRQHRHGSYVIRVQTVNTCQKVTQPFRIAPYQPLKSPDVNPPDLYLWGHLKALVHATPVDDVGTLRYRIVAGFETTRNIQGILQSSGSPCNGGLMYHWGPITIRTTKANRVQFPAESFQIFATRNYAGRCWSAGFLGYLPFPPPLHSGTAPHSPQSPSSALNISLLRAAQNRFTHSNVNPQSDKARIVKCLFHTPIVVFLFLAQKRVKDVWGLSFQLRIAITLNIPIPTVKYRQLFEKCCTLFHLCELGKARRGQGVLTYVLSEPGNVALMSAGSAGRAWSCLARRSLGLGRARIYFLPKRSATSGGGRGGSVVRLLASHLVEPRSIPDEVAPVYSHLGIFPNDPAGQRTLVIQENALTSWTGDRDEVHFEPPKLGVRNLDPRSATIIDKCNWNQDQTRSWFGTRIIRSRIGEDVGAIGHKSLCPVEQVANKSMTYKQKNEEIQLAFNNAVSTADEVRMGEARAGETGAAPRKPADQRHRLVDCHVRKSWIVKAYLLQIRFFFLGVDIYVGATAAERLDCSPPTRRFAFGSIPGRVARGLGIVLDDADGRRFSRGSPILPALAFRHCSIHTSFNPHRLSRPLYESPKSLNNYKLTTIIISDRLGANSLYVPTPRKFASSVTCRVDSIVLCTNMPTSAAHWLSAATVEGDDWVSVLYERFGRLFAAMSWEPMRVIEASVEQCRDSRAGETRDPIENPPNSIIVATRCACAIIQEWVVRAYVDGLKRLMVGGEGGLRTCQRSVGVLQSQGHAFSTRDIRALEPRPGHLAW
ncbi:hypothetical protein PR048_022760 [Dryococelus australis]|uniref:Uncharacterized protein n=1 Tax=Dryococelus australis TaxID=614101 RepID=A0ABQ9GS47_9NEOP|nr:hypothetical protein PR048_022760 [Dryococelus australis]